jgi:hypothetical protein
MNKSDIKQNLLHKIISLIEFITHFYTSEPPLFAPLTAALENFSPTNFPFYYVNLLYTFEYKYIFYKKGSCI